MGTVNFTACKFLEFSVVVASQARPRLTREQSKVGCEIVLAGDNYKGFEYNAIVKFDNSIRLINYYDREVLLGEEVSVLC